MVRDAAHTPSSLPARSLGWMISLILPVVLPSCTEATRPLSLKGRMISKVIIRHNLPEKANRENDARLRHFMSIREGRRYSTRLADDTIRSLFESGLIDNARLLAEEDGQSIRILVEVEDRPECGPCLPRFIGNTAFSDQRLAKVIRPRLKEPITESDLEAARQKLEHHYREWGYKQVRITINDERWGKRSIENFAFEIEEGPKTLPWYEGLLRSPGHATPP